MDFERRWSPDPLWTTDPEIVENTVCRYGAGNDRGACGRPAVAAMNRKRWTESGGYVPQWWTYCDEHMYGRRIRGGVVEAQRLVPVT